MKLLVFTEHKDTLDSSSAMAGTSARWVSSASGG